MYIIRLKLNPATTPERVLHQLCWFDWCGENVSYEYVEWCDSIVIQTPSRRDITRLVQVSVEDPKVINIKVSFRRG